jgi:hypothetical protein
MATQNLGQTISLEAGADLTSSQYRFVKLSSGKAALCGDGEDAIGVLQNDPNSGQEAAVALSGITKVVAGGMCTQDGYGASDSSGRAVDAVTGDFTLCRFLEAATTAGEIVSAVLLPAHPVVA